MLCSLRQLRTLRINKMSHIMPIESLSLALRELPPTLMELEISCSGADFAFLNYKSAPWGLCDTIEITKTKHGYSRLFNIAERFPSLKTLRIWDPTEMGSHAFDLCDLGVLPEYLETLAISVVLERGDLAILPRHLTKLEVSFSSENFSADISHLPRSLTYLAGFLCTEGDYEMMARYPRSLTNGDSFCLFQEFGPALAAALPPSIKALEHCDSFKVDDFKRMGFCPWTAVLPQKLTKLCLSLVPSETILRKEDIAALPKTLIELHNLQIEWSSLTTEDEQTEATNLDLSFWPSSLRTISFLESQVSIESANDLNYFPRSLERLLGLQTGNKFIFSVPFPPLLKELEVQSESGVLECPLPTSLQILRLEGAIVLAENRNETIFPATLTNVSLLICPHICSMSNGIKTSMFSRGVTSMTLAGCDPKTFFEIPRAVTSLTIVNLEGRLSSKYFSALPINLKNLSIGKICLAGANANLIFESFSALPRGLSSLRITHTSLPGSVLRYLPRDLQDLGLRFDTLQGDDLRQMPLAKLRTFTPYRLSDIKDVSMDVSQSWPETPLTLAEMDQSKDFPLAETIRKRQTLLRRRNSQFPDPRVVEMCSNTSL